MTFDPTKPVQTRNGKKARILATDLKGSGGTSICAVITLPDGQETCVMYWSRGHYLSNGDHDWDLVNVPEEKTSRMMLHPPIYKVAGVWVNITTRDNKVVKIELD